MRRRRLRTTPAWCQTRIAANSDARLLVIAPGAPGERERLTARIRQALDPAAILDGARGRSQQGGAGREGSHWRSSRSSPRPSPPLSSCPAQHANSKRYAPGCARRSGRSRRPRPGRHWRSPCVRADYERRTARFSGGAARRGRPNARAQPVSSPRSCSNRRMALKESGASARSWSEYIDACLALAGWPGTMAPGAAARGAAALARAARGVPGR